MARNLGTSTQAGAPPGAAPGLPPATTAGQGVPRATRSGTPGWRDPRLWVGVAIVAASVVAGSRVLAAADDTVAVWAVAADSGPGDRLEEGDLVVQRVRFTGAGALAAYFTVEDELPADLELLRGVTAGELLPRAAVGSAATSDLLQVPVAVEPEQVPDAVDDGSVVDVYLLGAPAPPAEGAAGAGGAVSRPPDGPVLSAVTVLDAPRPEDSFGTTGRRQLVLAVPEADAAAFFALLGAADDPLLTVVGRG